MGGLQYRSFLSLVLIPMPPKLAALDIRYFDDYEAEYALQTIDILAETPIAERPGIMEVRGVTGEYLHELLRNLKHLEERVGRKTEAHIQSERE